MKLNLNEPELSAEIRRNDYSTTTIGDDLIFGNTEIFWHFLPLSPQAIFANAKYSKLR